MLFTSSVGFLAWIEEPKEKGTLVVVIFEEEGAAFFFEGFPL